MHHLVKDPDKQLRQAVDGFRQVMKRGGLVGLTVLTGRAARLMSRPPSFATRR